MTYIIVISIALAVLAFASKNNKLKKITILQPKPDHNAKKIPLAIKNRVRVKGIGDGEVTDIGNYRVEVKFDANGKKKWFFKSKIIRI